jgi:hypothetical protein
MKDSGRRQPRISKLRHSLPCQVVLLTSTPKRSSPEIADIVAERAERPGIRRHRVVCEEPRDHCPQPSALFGDGVVHAATQFLLDLAKLRPHAVAPALALELKGSASRPPANEREPQEAEGFWLTQPAVLSSRRRMATELQQPGLFPVKLERKLLEPRSHRVPEAPRVGFVLEAGNNVVGIA